MAKFKKRIVKVQLSIFSDESSKQQVLVYDKNRDNHFQGDVPKEVKRVMGKELKKYFYAKIPLTPGFIELLEEAPEQSW
ncbi:MAG: hypothetical protein V4469_04485 [Patescibacteria group bacterium]